MHGDAGVRLTSLRCLSYSRLPYDHGLRLIGPFSHDPCIFPPGPTNFWANQALSEKIQVRSTVDLL